MAQPNIVEGFISEETAVHLHEFLKDRAVINPKGLPNVYLKDFINGNEPYTYLEKDLINKIEKGIASQFDFKQSQIELDRMNYQILPTGEELGWHTDSYGGVEGYTDTYYSALLYLNDDYTGGEIVFYDDNSGTPESGTAYKPKPGTLIYFKGDKDHPHSVNKVLSGERANIILFYNVKI
jgi:hypothetical protein